MTDTEIIEDILTFSQDYSYLAESFKSVQVTSIGRTYDLTKLANGKYNKATIKSNNGIQKEEQELDIDNGYSR